MIMKENNQVSRLGIRVLAGISFIVVVMFGAAGVASASDQRWAVSSGGVQRGTSNFDDAANRVYVHDNQDDNGFMRMDVWRVGNKGGTHVVCKAATNGPGGSPKNNDCPLIWVEDTHLKGELCWVRVSTKLACSAVKEFFS